MPIFANIDVSAANIADNNANTNHISVRFYLPAAFCPALKALRFDSTTSAPLRAKMR
jgi:hypothetical protein